MVDERRSGPLSELRYVVLLGDLLVPLLLLVGFDIAHETSPALCGRELDMWSTMVGDL